jgi:hypothetical protein
MHLATKMITMINQIRPSAPSRYAHTGRSRASCGADRAVYEDGGLPPGCTRSRNFHRKPRRAARDLVGLSVRVAIVIGGGPGGDHAVASFSMVDLRHGWLVATCRRRIWDQCGSARPEGV